MKLKYIIGGVIAIIFVVIAVYSFNSSKIEYTDFKSAKQSGKTVQVIGSLDKSQKYAYNSEDNSMTFNMIDEKGNHTKVITHGSKPNNFDVAPMLVIKGKYENDIFVASEILTKCPSKYEGSFEELKGTTLYNDKH